MSLRRAVGLGMLVAVFAILPSTRSAATIEEIEASGKYYLGDNDTRIDGHRLALMDAKRNALEKAGTYVQSITEVKDFQLTRDDIRSYTAGIVEVTETSEPKWELVGQTQRVTVTVKARVDKDVITKKIAALRTDKEATKELKDARVNEKEHEHKIAELNRQLKKAKKGSPAAARARQARSNEFAGVDAVTLRAQAAGAKAFSQQSWVEARDYVNRNVNLKGCMPFKGGASNSASLLPLALPAVALAGCRSRRRTKSTTARTRESRDGTCNETRGRESR